MRLFPNDANPANPAYPSPLRHLALGHPTTVTSLVTLGLLCLGPQACGPIVGQDPSDGTTTRGSSSSSSGSQEPSSSSSTTTLESSSGPSADSTGTTTGGLGGVPARGVEIDVVELNPGVAIPIAEGGQWIPLERRNGQIPRGRNAVMRVAVDVDESIWVPRELESRLLITHADDTQSVYIDTRQIAEDSSVAQFDSNFLFDLPAEAIQAGALFQVELYETDGDYDSLPEVEVPPAALPEPGLIGVEPSPLSMRMLLVPVQYEHTTCSAVTDLNEQRVASLGEILFQHNPLETLEIEVREPYVVNDLNLGVLDDYYELLNRAVQLRADDAPDPNVYYYMIADTCGICVPLLSGACALGVSPGIPGDSMGDAAERVALGILYPQPGGEEVAHNTFVHEVGHLQGRGHALCPGSNPTFLDLDFPYPEGGIGAWGFGVRDLEVRGEDDHYDYMSYCDPSWVSDWQWDATFHRIQTLSSWEESEMTRALDQHKVLVGSYDPETGKSTWWTDRGWVGEGDADPRFSVRFIDKSTTLERVSAVSVSSWSEGPRLTIRANLPDDFDRSTEIEFTTPTRSVRVGASKIRRAR